MTMKPRVDAFVWLLMLIGSVELLLASTAGLVSSVVAPTTDGGTNGGVPAKAAVVCLAMGFVVVFSALARARACTVTLASGKIVVRFWYGARWQASLDQLVGVDDRVRLGVRGLLSVLVSSEGRCTRVRFGRHEGYVVFRSDLDRMEFAKRLGLE